MAILRELGLVVSIHGRGTFIAPHDTANAARNAALTPGLVELRDIGARHASQQTDASDPGT